MSKQLEILIRQSGLASEAQLSRAQERVVQSAGSLLDVLLKEEGIPEEAVADLFVTRLKVPRVRVATFLLDEEALRKVPERLARKYDCLPLSIEGRILVLAMVNPIDYPAIQDLEFATSLSIRPMVATRQEVLDGIEERYGAKDRLASFLANVPDAPDIQVGSGDLTDSQADLGESLFAAGQAPVVKMCNLIIHDAILSKASDVHIEPTLHDVQVRMRVDGVLRDYTRAPKWLHGPVVSRLKILAKLDIAERRMPQDGRVNVRFQGRSIDLRVSTLPTHFGEKMVLRVLGSGSAPRIDGLGLSLDQQHILEAALQQPQGMILVTGPTGSGKTTTLYALLANHLNAEVNIVTVEDPIEYQLARISQVQINPKAGLTFASALRSILRQDPDVILVGEMRDKETAEIAFQASMTGHLVLSTLHTNSAIGAIGRMFDLNVDPSIMATSLTLVVAQRLVRRLCIECREQYTPEAAALARAGLTSDDGPIYRGRGCTACGGTGYSGRVGVYEVFRPTNAIRKLINDRASEAELRSASRQMGMALLREDALEKIRAGLTSPDEVLRVVQADDTEVPCPSCNAIIETVFSTCPYCRHSLKKLCANCEQPLKFDWKLCPYCNSDAQVQLLVEDLGDARRDRRAQASDEVTRQQPRVVRIEEDPWGLVIEPEAMKAEAPVAVTPGRGGQRPASPPAAAFAPSKPTSHETIAKAGPAAPLPPAAVSVLAPVDRTVDPETGRRLLRVMVVDDDPDIRMIVSAALHKLPVAVEVVQAEDGVDAVEKATAAAPDLVVLDVMMPRMDGFETCRALRENVRTAFVPILMLTASADQNSRTKGYLIGSDDYMSKPFLPADLVLRVTRLLRRTYGI